MKTCDTCKHHVQFRGQRMECKAHTSGYLYHVKNMRCEIGPCGPEGKLYEPIETKTEEEKNG